MDNDTFLSTLSTYHERMQRAQAQETKDSILCQLVLSLFPFVPSQEARDKIAEILREYNSEDRINHKHPETGLSKQEMTHYRRGETEARMWLHGNKEATREEFELAGKMWIRHSKSAEHVQELILKGWMSVWQD